MALLRKIMGFIAFCGHRFTSLNKNYYHLQEVKQQWFLFKEGCNRLFYG